MIDEEEKPKPPSDKPFACIMRRDGVTFCHRNPARAEFTFSREGAEHVIAHYDPRRMKVTKHRLAGCTACIDEAKVVIENEAVGMVNRT